MMGILGQLFGQQQPGILGQEIGAQPQTGPGFMGQADLHPQVAAQQNIGQMQGMVDQLRQQHPGQLQGTVDQLRQHMLSQMMGQMTGGQQGAQQQQLPLPLMQQGAQTMQAPQIDPNAAYQQWIQSRNLPTLGVLGGMANGLR